MLPAPVRDASDTSFYTSQIVSNTVSAGVAESKRVTTVDVSLPSLFEIKNLVTDDLSIQNVTIADNTLTTNEILLRTPLGEQVSLRPSAVTSSLLFQLPPNTGSNDQAFTTAGTGVTYWGFIVGNGTVTSLTAGTGLQGGTIVVSGEFDLDIPVSIAHGGTNSTQSLSNKSIIISASDSILEAGTFSNGVVLIGSTGNPPVPSTLIPNNGISITNGSGSITVGLSVVPIVSGGTNSSTSLNNNQIIVSSGGKLVEAGSMANGSILIGNTNNLPTVGTLTGGSNIFITPSSGSINISVTGTVPITRGGTNATSLTPNGIMLSSGGSLVSTTLADGQLLIGRSGLSPVPNTLTQGSGISITSSSGSISLSISSPIAISNGGTNSTSFTNNRFVMSSGGSLISAPELKDGQLLIGSGTVGSINSPVAANLSGGTNISIGSSGGAISVGISGVLSVANGGTNSSNALSPQSCIMVSSSNQITESSALINGQVLIGRSGGFPPLPATLTNGSNISITNSSGSIAVGISAPISIENGGTNSTDALLNNRIMISSGGKIVESSALLNGQMIIGSTSGAIQVAGLTAGNGLTVTPGSGTTSVSFTAPISVANGGTNSATTLLNNRLMVSSGGKIVETASALTNGQVYIGVTSGIPFAASLSSGTGITITPSSGSISIGISSPISIANGGTNSTTALTNNSIMISSAGKIVEAGTMNNGTVLIGSTLSSAVVGTLTGNNITVTPGSGSITISLPTVSIANGGTNSTTSITSNFFIVSSNGKIVETPTALTNGQLFIGVSGSLPSAASVTQGTGLTLTPGLGSLQVSLPLVSIANGGTNSSTALSGSTIMVSSGGSIVQGPALSDGQVLIGRSGNSPVAGNITAGNNISVTTNIPTDYIRIAVTGVVPIARGGTNSSTLNNNQIMISSGGAIVGAGAMTNGQILIGSTLNPPQIGTITAGTGIQVTPGAGSLTVGLSNSGVISIANGGTGSGTALINRGVMISNSAANAIVEGPAMTNGQLLIGRTGLSPVAANLISGDQIITITNGAGTIALSITSANQPSQTPPTNDTLAQRTTTTALVTSRRLQVYDSTAASVITVQTPSIASNSTFPFPSVLGVPGTIFTTNGTTTTWNTQFTWTNLTLSGTPSTISPGFTRLAIDNATNILYSTPQAGVVLYADKCTSNVYPSGGTNTYANSVSSFDVIWVGSSYAIASGGGTRYTYNGFTVPVDGLYKVALTSYVCGNPSPAIIAVRVTRSGTPIYTRYYTTYQDDYGGCLSTMATAVMDIFVLCQANDVMTFYNGCNIDVPSAGTGPTYVAYGTNARNLMPGLTVTLVPIFNNNTVTMS